MINHVEPLYGPFEIKAVEKYLNEGGFLTEHKYTEKFEKALARFLKVPHVSLVPNGTSALYLSLLASGIKSGSKVLVPDLTMIASANAVRMAGGKVILFDVSKVNACLSALDLSKYLKNNKVDAVIAVDLNGRSPELYEVLKLSKKYKFVLIEDACQAFGSKYKGKYLGTFGRFGCFSLGFHKIITTGQGGFIVTHNKKDYESIEKLKDFGRLKGGNDIHDSLGFNFKFTDLQAVFGLCQLRNMRWRIRKKRRIYRWYTGRKMSKNWVPWFIEVWSDNPKKIKNYLKKHGIESRLLYPPIDSQRIYPKGKFPATKKFSSTGLWLPSSLSLTRNMVRIIVNLVKEVDSYANF